MKRYTVTELGRKLNCPPHMIQIWRDQQATMPDRKVLVLMEMVNEMGL